MCRKFTTVETHSSWDMITHRPMCRSTDALITICCTHRLILNILGGSHICWDHTTASTSLAGTAAVAALLQGHRNKSSLCQQLCHTTPISIKSHLKARLINNWHASVYPPGDGPHLRFMLSAWLCVRYKFSYYYYYTSWLPVNDGLPNSQDAATWHVLE